MANEDETRRIKSVTAKPGYRLTVGFEKGGARSVDLSEMVSKGGVFAPLSDSDAFAAVRIGENSRIIEWPSPADEDGDPIIAIDADALYERSVQQHNDSLAATMRRLTSSVGRVVRIRPPSGGGAAKA